jgi:beta-glucosidase-like glycosyl hydrolase
MNKKLIKKMIKKNQAFDGVIYADGNNGGDILEIHDNMNGTLHLTSGHCCVMTINKTVPVEFITAILSKVMLENDNDINKVIDSFDWPEQFKQKLKDKVK